MKKLTFLILLALFIVANVSSQPCLYNGITFNTQAEIDNFQTNYPNCTEIWGDVEISDAGGGIITNLIGLNVLTAIGGSLLIDINYALTSLTGLDNVSSIGGDLVISYNPVLTSLTGLDNLSSISGSLVEIHHNPALTSLTGLSNLTSIGGDLDIFWNPALTSLTGLNNVTSIGGDLIILDNDALTSLTGLNNINANSISDLYIYDNPSLSTCEVQSVCDYLASPNGTVEIHDNALGCNSQAEVDSACATVSIEKIDFKDEVSIFPNPTDKELFITTKDGTIINEVNIYNQIGQRVLHETRLTDVIDVSELRQGMYIIELVSDEFIIREKLIIK